MNEARATIEDAKNIKGERQRLPIWMSGVLPLLLLGILVAVFITFGPLGTFKAAFPPIEKLSIQRIILRPDEMILKVVNDGPEPVTVAQVLINDAYWKFTMEPSQTIPRLGRATIKIPYPWVEGDMEKVTLISRNGLTFEAEVEVATETPAINFRYLSTFALLGVYVGVIPVCLGLLWLPFLKWLRGGWYDFFLALTVGLLVFLGVDALVEAIETSEKTPEVYQSAGVVTLGISLAILIISALGHRARTVTRERGEAFQKIVLAYMIAFGIGVHNLAEGLAIGGAYAVGEIALGALLVLGFMIHNVTEGVAIIAPIAKIGPRLGSLVSMGLLAGVPTILGTWIGGFSYSAIWSVFFLSIGAGAIFQVVIDIVRYMAKKSWSSLVTFGNISGFLAGLLIMYITGFFVMA